ncbi:MAG: hypothetical protein ACJAVK_002385 [Akkermansiaceae bacterium]|jgi:hypothetical protein
MRSHLILIKFFLLTLSVLANDEILKEWRGSTFFEDSKNVKFSTHFASDVEIRKSGIPSEGYIFSKFKNVGVDQRKLLLKKLEENNFATVQSKHIFVKDHMCVLFESGGGGLVISSWFSCAVVWVV